METVEKKDYNRAKMHCPVQNPEMLKTLRELQELNQQQLAEMTGLSQSNLSALERGARKIGRERAIMLAKALEVHPAVILFSDFEMDDVP